MGLDPALYDQSISKTLNGDELDRNDLRRLRVSHGALFNHFENAQNQRLKNYWIEFRRDFRDSFVAEIYELMEIEN